LTSYSNIFSPWYAVIQSPERHVTPNGSRAQKGEFQDTLIASILRVVVRRPQSLREQTLDFASLKAAATQEQIQLRYVCFDYSFSSICRMMLSSNTPSGTAPLPSTTS
jgi:hypothetical protein